MAVGSSCAAIQETQRKGVDFDAVSSIVMMMETPPWCLWGTTTSGQVGIPPEP